MNYIVNLNNVIINLIMHQKTNVIVSYTFLGHIVTFILEQITAKREPGSLISWYYI